MAKAILTFNLNDEDDREYHMCAVRAKDIYLCLFDLSEFLRAQIKHANLKESYEQALSDVHDELTDILERYSLDLTILS